MAYLVDGNNVMGQIPGWHRDKAKARRGLIERLAVFVRTKRVRITVVFDGTPDREFPEGSAYRGVKVLYASAGSDADSRICRLVEQARDPRGLTVVTSDRRLASQVRSSGASVIRSGEFRKEMDDAASRVPAEEKDERFAGTELNDWLRYFGAEEDDDQE